MTFPILLFLTGVVLALTAERAWARHRDPFHPALFLSPLLFYSYVYRPALLQYRNLLEDFLRPDDLFWIGVVNLLGICAFCWGLLSISLPKSVSTFVGNAIELPPAARRAVVTLACWFGFLAVGAYFWMLARAGGLVEAYDGAKGGGSAPSGYVGEAQLLAIPAIFLLFLAWQGQRLTPSRWTLLLTFALPNLIQGFLGTRRGPTFIILATLLFGVYLRSNRRSGPVRLLLGVGAIGVIVLFLFSNRKQIYLGSSEFAMGSESLGATIAPTETTVGDEYIHGGALMLTSRENEFHYWGKRYLVILLVRPIPRQLWPTKYEDVGFGWMTSEIYLGGMTMTEWMRGVHWLPLPGASPGFIADLFLEVSYGVVIVVFLFGKLYAALWSRFRVRRLVWIPIYLFTATLAVYVPTQSFSAWLHRFLIMSLPTLFLWEHIVAPRHRRWLRQAARRHDQAVQEAPSLLREPPPASSP